MSRTTGFALALALAFVGACERRSIFATTDAEVDHRSTADPVATVEAPASEPPLAIGGGPPEETYERSSALNVLRAAHCARARLCGKDANQCDAEAAAEHGEELGQCSAGVRVPLLADCARVVRETSCDSAVAIPETCTASLLCEQAP